MVMPTATTPTLIASTGTTTSTNCTDANHQHLFSHDVCHHHWWLHQPPPPLHPNYCYSLHTPYSTAACPHSHSMTPPFLHVGFLSFFLLTNCNWNYLPTEYIYTHTNACTHAHCNTTIITSTTSASPHTVARP